MKIVLGFIYYFLMITIALTFVLAIFFIKPLRRLLHKYHKLTDNKVFNYIIYFSFVIVGIIFLQSLYDFTILSHHIDQSHFSGVNLERLNLIPAGQHGNSVEGFMETLRQYRKYYQSQRNMMLTGSSFFAYFIFNRMIAAIVKLAGIQQDIDNSRPLSQQKDKSPSPQKSKATGHEKSQ